jgi:hypothetical protein
MFRWPDIPAPKHTVMDIRRVHADYGDQALVMRIRVVDLARRGEGLGFGGDLRTSQGAEDFWFSTCAGPGIDDDCTGTWEPRIEVNPTGARASVTYSYQRDIIRIRIPAASLDGPRWVQFRRFVSYHLATDDDMTDDNDKVYLDRGLRTEDWSPRLYRN